MATAAVYGATVNLEADRETARWRPVVQWLLSVPRTPCAWRSRWPA